MSDAECCGGVVYEAHKEYNSNRVYHSYVKLLRIDGLYILRGGNVYWRALDDAASAAVGMPHVEAQPDEILDVDSDWDAMIRVVELQRELEKRAQDAMGNG